MRAFAVFVGLILAALAVVAVLAYPAWLAVAPLLDEARFHRVGSRLAMVCLAIGLVLVARRLRLTDRTSLGYGLPRAAFLRELGLALALAVVLILPVLAIMLAIGLREPRPDVTLDLLSVAGFAARGLATGLAVAFIEETFLRGAMFTAIARESGTRAAVVLTSILYALAHFFAKVRLAPEDLDWGSGLDLVRGWLANFGAPLAQLDSFVALFAVGVLLAVTRAITGNIAACIGLHAGWVLIIAVVRDISLRDAGHPWSVLVGSYDGFVGWLVLAWTVLIGVPLVIFYRRRAIKPTRMTQTTRTT